MKPKAVLLFHALRMLFCKIRTFADWMWTKFFVWNMAEKEQKKPEDSFITILMVKIGTIID